MPQCAVCSGVVPAGSRFCPSCGRTMVAAEPPTEVMPASGTAAKPAQSRSSSSLLTSSSAPSSDGSRFLPGTLLAERYRIVALLGRGGMGEVYRADDLTLGQPVALKFLAEAVTQNEDDLRRFRNEVRIARQVSHPNVCRVYDVGEIDGRLFLSMEYVDGEDLGSLLRRIGRLPSDKGLEIARKLCAGLAAAHEKGVLHRDLKPGNIMLDGRGQVLLTDFGLAGLAEQITGADVRSGTPAYMAPEQLAGNEVTTRSDIYSLGLVLYELFTGKRAFEASTLDELLRLRSHTTPAGPSTLVRDLDPAVERVILRCLDPEPANRPSSALAVSAALPGGDPLAAALAAGETPSPQMVAAAGEGVGLSPRAALGLFAAVIVGIVCCAAVQYHRSALERMQAENPPEVLTEKATGYIRQFGYSRRPLDTASGFWWDTAHLSWEGRKSSRPPWDKILLDRPSPLIFWYRQSNYPLTAISFHDDVLTPGLTGYEDPPSVLSGMIRVALDPQGRLMNLEAIPPQIDPPPKQAPPPPDWNALLAAAGLDAAKLQPSEPEWTWLGTSDVRAAWTGAWPGTSLPLRVEAAAWRGRPVAFTVTGPWRKPERMPAESNSREDLSLVILGAIALTLLVGGALLARRNLVQGRGDRRAASRLAFWIFLVEMGLWITRSHFTLSIGVIAMFLLAVCTAVFYAAFIWTIYIALEPYVRRYWPRTIISSTRVLTNQVRDPMVGRDVLFGIALAICWTLAAAILQMTAVRRDFLELLPSELLLGTRSMAGWWLMSVPRSVRAGLTFFFLLFLLRVLLRNQWLGAAAFVFIFTGFEVLNSESPLISAALGILTYGLAALVVLRYGLLSLMTGAFVATILFTVSPTLNTSAWYFANSSIMLLSVLAIALWAFFAALGGRRLWKQDLFG